MAELRHFTLTQLKQMLDGDNELMANNYISQNIAISRRVNPWVITEQFRQGPMMMPEMRLLIVRQGHVEPVINLSPRRFSAGDLVFVGPNSIVQVNCFDSTAEGMGLSMSDDLFSLAIGNRMPKAFDGHLRDFSLHLEPSELDFLDHIHHLIYINTRQEGHSAQVTLHLIGTFLWYVDHLWSRHEEANRQSLTREQRLFADFLQLVSQHAPRRHTIDFYADRLCLSPRYMSTIVKRVSGKPAKQWIDEAILTRIKIELRHTDDTVAEIAYAMNFPNPSFFCKFFKRLTGITPLEYKTSKDV